MSKNTKTKYYQFMCTLYDMKEFDIKEMQRDYRISTRLITLMRENQMIKRDGSITHWIGDKPTQAIANAFTKECLKQSRICNSQSKAGTQQMIIKPLKKVEYVAPQLVNIDSTHTPYPLMDIVIAFFSGMVAAGFITLIWK